MFFHFGVNTWGDVEWGTGTENPAAFNPTAFDAAQWMRAAKSAGAKYVVLTAKHHDGFCLWPTRTTTHSVKSSPWRNGQGDVVREVANAARAAGLGLGLYLSPWDRNNKSFGTGDAYNDFYIAQLTELLTNYGALTEVWFDGANGDAAIGKKQKYDWNRIHTTVRRLQPNALMFSDAGPDIRWIGNELGTASDTNWCTVDPSIVTEPGMDGPQIIAALQHGAPPPSGTVWQPGEADVSIRPRWFYHPAEDAKVKSPVDLTEIWMNSVGRNANLLLNVPPTKAGLLADADVKSLDGFGGAQRAFWSSVEELRSGTMRGHSILASLPRRRPISAAIVEEDLAQGQRVSSYHIDVSPDGVAWTTVARGSTIGHRRIERITPTDAAQVRVVVDGSLDIPQFRRLRVAYA